MSQKARTAEVSLRVSPPRHTQRPAEATNLSPGDGFPAVLATSRIIELMELAAARLMKPHLRDGESSVAIATNVTHVSRSAVSGHVRVVATPEGVSGRLHRFTIHAFDETGLIGSADHTRAPVVEKKLLALARRRVGQPSLMLDV
jgi:fluoroacetyl-CoA thioesterase